MITKIIEYINLTYLTAEYIKSKGGICEPVPFIDGNEIRILPSEVISGKYKSYVPNDDNGFMCYWERQGAVNIGEGYINTYRYNANIRMIVHADSRRLNNIKADELTEHIISLIPQNIGIIENVASQVRIYPTRIDFDFNSLFGKYNYDKAGLIFMHPYIVFAIEYELSYISVNECINNITITGKC